MALYKRVVLGVVLPPSVAGLHWEFEQRFDARKSPYTSTCGVGLIVVVLYTILLLIADQKVAEAALLKRRKVVLLAPDAVDLIQFLGADAPVCCQADIAFRLHEQQNVVGTFIKEFTQQISCILFQR